MSKLAIAAGTELAASAPADPPHHVVTGIDAQRAGDAFKLLPVADIDSHGADHDAIVAIDTVAPRVPRITLSVGVARLAAVGSVCDGQGFLVHHS